MFKYYLKKHIDDRLGVKKTVFFIPGYYYNSIETFRNIGNNLDKNLVQIIFLDMGDPTFRAANLNFLGTDFHELFDGSYFLNYPDLGKRWIFRVFDLLSYRNKLMKIVRMYQPDIIVTTNDRNRTYLLLKRMVKNTPIILLQTSLINLDYYDDKVV